jgi:carbamoyl-phosphate synthase/aspartate carbamoyltransferase/dihydroorotase
VITLPGLVDVHVHLRQPGGEHKEDWTSGTTAALAGGITTVLAMPNTDPPVTDAATLEATLGLAADEARCDYALYIGATPGNAGTAAQLAPDAAGLKMYLDDTFGPLRLDDISDWASHLAAWPRDRPVVAHAEGRTAAAVILAAHLAGRPIHLCHVSSRAEIEMIARAKDAGMAVTCEVTPHHLFLTTEDVAFIGQRRATVRPPLGTADDQRALWDHLEVIDCFATDHAPHLPREKDGPQPPPGFPGLETAVPLLIDAVNRGRLTVDDITQRMHSRPVEIFGLPTDDTTFVEVDPEATWSVRADEMASKSGWTPFEGRRLQGRISRVVLRGEEVYANGVITGRPRGRNLRRINDS